ncbi:hypothetical protein F4778DRAFT_733894 [Xylariomycetidae sp. FL2044]|nr:hypothetical protein F4778DRAFT_733894 [Xylariomycetidae sp. FL2044]
MIGLPSTTLTCLLLFGIQPVYSQNTTTSPPSALDPPQPWEVTSLGTYSPSGRPGEANRDAFIRLSITDPNDLVPAGQTAGADGGAYYYTFNSSAANCTVAWPNGRSDPYDKMLSCDVAEGDPVTNNWTFEVLRATQKNDTTGGSPQPAASPTTNFDIRFTLWHSMYVRSGGGSGTFRKYYEGTQNFRVGTNMQGTCGSSGVCSWGLKADAKPVLVQPVLTECQGIC